MTMAEDRMETDRPAEQPAVRNIGPSDLKYALSRGLQDFWAMPTHVIFIGLVYAVAGLVLGRIALGYDVIPILYPLAAGFALLGPIAAIGLYEMSRRRELGLKTSWTDGFSVTKSPSWGAIMILGVMLLVLFVVWITVADALFRQTFGDLKPVSLPALVKEILSTNDGLWLLIVGNAAGFVFAAAALILSAISFPLLLDRKLSAPEAALTSIRVFAKNPFTMTLWGQIVAIGLVIGSLPLFAGLAIVLPVLGHSTWHLYRRVIEPRSPATAP